MNSESSKPYSWLSRFISSFSWLLPASTLNPFNQSFNADQQNNPQTDEPESSISVYNSEKQDDSEDQLHESIMSDLESGNPNTPRPKLEVELSPFSQADMETQDELGVTNSIPSYPPEAFYRIRADSNDNESAPPSPTPSIDSPMPFYYQMQTTAPLDLEFSPTEDSVSSSFDSFSTKSSSRDHGENITPPEPSFTSTKQSPNPKNSTVVGVHSFPPQPTTATKQNPNSKISSTKEGKPNPIHPVLEIILNQELGKHVLVLAIPMVMGLVFTYNPLSMTIEMHIVAVALCCAFAAIWNGIVLRRSYQTASTLLLMGGIALMLLAFYAFAGCFLPLELKWIPGLCLLASLFPPAKVLLAFFQGKNVAGGEYDIEKGKDL